MISRSVTPATLFKAGSPSLNTLEKIPHLRDHFFGPFEEHFNKFFDDYFAVQRKPLSHGFPKVDLYERDNKFIIEFAIAGADPNDVNIELKEVAHDFGAEYGRQLKVSGKMSTEYEHKQDAVYHVKEMSRKHFSRTILLRADIVSDPVATYKHGMLTLTFDLPTKQEVLPQVKNIAITVEGN